MNRYAPPASVFALAVVAALGALTTTATGFQLPSASQEAAIKTVSRTIFDDIRDTAPVRAPTKDIDGE